MSIIESEFKRTWESLRGDKPHRESFLEEITIRNMRGISSCGFLWSFRSPCWREKTPVANRPYYSVAPAPIKCRARESKTMFPRRFSPISRRWCRFSGKDGTGICLSRQWQTPQHGMAPGKSMEPKFFRTERRQTTRKGGVPANVGQFDQSFRGQKYAAN